MAYAKTFPRTGVVAGAIASTLIIFPTGDGNAKQVFKYQPIKGAAFEGLFKTERGAGLLLRITSYNVCDTKLLRSTVPLHEHRGDVLPEMYGSPTSYNFV